MNDMYKRIDALLIERGITGAKMSADLGMSRSFMTELRKGRAKSIKLETAQKIADYFGVPVSYLTGEDAEKAPTVSSERSIDIDEVDLAFYGEYKELSEEQKETIRDMVSVMRMRRAQLYIERPHNELRVASPVTIPSLSNPKDSGNKNSPGA